MVSIPLSLLFVKSTNEYGNIGSARKSIHVVRSGPKRARRSNKSKIPAAWKCNATTLTLRPASAVGRRQWHSRAVHRGASPRKPSPGLFYGMVPLVAPILYTTVKKVHIQTRRSTCVVHRMCRIMHTKGGLREKR